MKRLSLSIPLLALWISAVSARAAVSFSPNTEPSSGVDIRISSWVESMPHSGLVPLTVSIRNGSPAAQTWVLVTHNGGMTSTTDLEVPAGRAGEWKVFAPILAQSDMSVFSGELSFILSGHGVRNSSAGSLTMTAGYGSNRTEYIGMGKKLAAKGWSALKAKLSAGGTGSSATELDGSELDMAQAPDDWRGYSCLAQLWMEESEWQAMSAAARAAMLDWVALGGRVFVLATDASAAHAQQLGLATNGSTTRPHGAGALRLEAWDGKALPLERMVTVIQDAPKDSLRRHAGSYDKKWALHDVVGPLTLNSALIFSFIVIFGVLVGPVNLFWLAPAGQRQRMFWTTPLLSLAGSALLVGVMVLQDGVGGSGARLVLAILEPEQKRIAVMQEQVSKTGVLLGRSFPIAEPGWMQQIELKGSGVFSPLRNNLHAFRETPTTRSGEWFTSRAVQGHLLTTVRPSRATIEVFPAAAPAQPPTVLSSFETPLKKLFLVDANNTVWTAEDVGTGEKKATKPATHAQLEAWLNAGPKKLAGPTLSTALQRLGEQRECVFAEAAEASKLAVATLPSIRWNQDHALIAGPYVRR
ncbi:MAG: hypothetical protein ACOYMN_00710 [Roseimicrobium sp.]